MGWCGHSVHHYYRLSETLISRTSCCSVPSPFLFSPFKSSPLIPSELCYTSIMQLSRERETDWEGGVSGWPGENSITWCFCTGTVEKKGQLWVAQEWMPFLLSPTLLAAGDAMVRSHFHAPLWNQPCFALFPFSVIWRKLIIPGELQAPTQGWQPLNANRPVS